MSKTRRRRHDYKYRQSDKGRATAERHNAARRKTKTPTTAFRSYLTQTDPPLEAGVITDHGSRFAGPAQ